MELTEPVKGVRQAAAGALRGSARRRFLARTVAQRGPGGQRRAAREPGWSRVPIRKGQRELASGVTGVAACARRGRKRAQGHLPRLLADLAASGGGQRQADPACRTTRRYTRLTAGEVRRQRIAQHGYTAAGLPGVQPIGAPLHALG